jgi:hypothetical protein
MAEEFPRVEFRGLDLGAWNSSPLWMIPEALLLLLHHLRKSSSRRVSSDSAHPDALPPSKCPFRDRGRHRKTALCRRISGRRARADGLS